jgi:hypothetical protein
MPLKTLATAVTAAGSLSLALAGGVAAAPNPEGTLGQHVASYAQEHLGARDGAPAVTCTHDGMTMTFATFGDMVRHMRDIQS